MICVVARVSVKPGHEVVFEAVVQELVQNVRKSEAGCKVYKLCKGNAPDEYVFVESYDNQRALDYHMQTPHFQDASARLAPLLAGAPTMEMFAVVF